MLDLVRVKLRVNAYFFVINGVKTLRFQKISGCEWLFLYKGSGQNMLYSISTHLDQGTRKKTRPYTFKLIVRIKKVRDHEIY